MNSLVCIDASLILRTLLPGPHSQNAQALLTRWSQEQTVLVAPALLAFEVTAVLRRYVFLKELTDQEGEAALSQVLQLGIRLSHRRGIFPLAWELARQFNRPRAYDTAYLALAQLHECDFWTADQRLYNAVSHELSWVRWVGDFQPSDYN